MDHTVWTFLETDFNIHDDVARQQQIREQLSTIWPNDGAAAADLVPAAVQAMEANEDEFDKEVFVDEAKDFLRAKSIASGEPEEDRSDEAIEISLDWWFGLVNLLPYYLLDTLNVIDAEAMATIVSELRDAECSIAWKATLIRLAANLPRSPLHRADSTAYDEFAGILVEELTDQTDPRERHPLRVAAAIALGKLKRGGLSAINALTAVAKDPSEPQLLRAECIEALLDIGPPAASSAAVLKSIMDNDENEDLQNFAWAALKSVTADSEEHPCGGTVSEHIRSLYTSKIVRPEDPKP